MLFLGEQVVVVGGVFCCQVVMYVGGIVGGELFVGNQWFGGELEGCFGCYLLVVVEGQGVVEIVFEYVEVGFGVIMFVVEFFVVVVVVEEIVGIGYQVQVKG